MFSFLLLLGLGWCVWVCGKHMCVAVHSVYTRISFLLEHVQTRVHTRPIHICIFCVSFWIIFSAKYQCITYEKHILHVYLLITKYIYILYWKCSANEEKKNSNWCACVDSSLFSLLLCAIKYACCFLLPHCCWSLFNYSLRLLCPMQYIHTFSHTQYSTAYEHNIYLG